jgi:hypothetical protein
LEDRYGKTLEGKSQTALEISRVLTKVRSPFEVDLLVRRAVDTLGVREEILRRPNVIRGSHPSAARTAAVPLSSLAQNREDIAERSLIGLMLRFPSVIGDVEKEQEVRRWIESPWQQVIDLILSEWQERGRLDLFRVTQGLSPAMAAQMAALALEAESIPEADCAKMVADCLSHLRRKHLRELERNLRIAIRAAEEQKDEKAKRERILEWQDVVRKERQLERRRPEPKITSR